VSRRPLLWLALGSILVAGLAAFLAGKPRSESELLGQKVFADLESNLNAVTEVRLSKGDGERVTLRKGATDWRVAERDYPADAGRIRKLLLDLAALEVQEEKTRTAANYPKLGVEDVARPEATGALLEVIAPKQSYTLIIGKPAGTKATYVRVPKNEQSLQAKPQVIVDTDPKRWIDRTLLDLPRERVREVRVQTPGAAPYSVSRTTREQTDFAVQGIPKGRELTMPTVGNAAASALTGLTLDDVRRATQPREPQKERATATFHTFDGLTLEVAGHKEGERHYLTGTAKSGAKETAAEAQRLNARLAGWEFEIPAYKYDAIFKPLDDMLVEKPS
jgi:hypothetical protein